MKMPKNLSFPIRLGIGICVLFCCTVSFMYRTGFNLVLSEMTRNSTEVRIYLEISDKNIKPGILHQY